MSGYHPERQDNQGGNGDTYSVHREPSQDEETHQIQSYYEDNGYNYHNSQNYDSRTVNYHHQSAMGSALPMGGYYDNPYSQHQYQNGYASGYYNVAAWDAASHQYAYTNGSEEPYVRGDYNTSYNYQHRPYAARSQPPPRRRRHPNAAPPTPPPRSPSPTYLSASLSPSVSAETPSRKLLILDLNGTLLFRPKPDFQSRPSRSTPPVNPEDEPPSSHPFHPHSPAPFKRLKRTVYTRPYLSSFGEYIFHPFTQEWLDVMIWSSAQPHSVRDMLQRCFPTPEKKHDGDKEAAEDSKKADDRFTAIWARDTLGLSSVDYSRKTQTTKDLNKPWSQLPPFQLPLNTTEVPDKESISHSAYTTLLLDDSPRKAHLQPWNHVCLREYDDKMRDEDVKTLQDFHRQSDVEPNSRGDQEGIAPTSDSAAISSSQSSARLTSSSCNSPDLLLDLTLLAVIGVLEAIKYESNVAAWIRAGGLWASHHNGEVQNEQAIDSVKSAAIRSPPVQSMPRNSIKRGRDPDSADPRSSSPEVGSSKRPRLESPNIPSPSDKAHEVELDRNPHSPPPSLPPSILSSSLPASPEPGNDGDTKGDHELETSQQPLWFSHAPTFDHWVSRGRETLSGLGIKIEHGVMIDQEIEK